MNAQVIDYDKLHWQVAVHPYPLVFATISGAHLYGFPSADSDFDLRGVHLLPLEDVVGLDPGEETVEKSGVHDGIEMDFVTHDAKKFFGLMLTLNETAKLAYLDELVERKLAGPEKGRLEAADVEFHEHEYERLVAALESAAEKSTLPERPSGRDALNDLLVRLRVNG